MTLLQNIITGISVGGLYSLYALGIAVVYGVAGIINFAHGYFIAFAAYVLLALAGVPVLVAIVCALAAGIAIAVATERGVFRFARGADPGTLLVLAFAVALAIKSLLTLVAGSDTVSTSFGSELAKPLQIGSLSIVWIDLVTIVVAGVMLAGLALLLNRTPVGVQLRAAAEDFTMARLVGVRSNRVMMVAFAVSGLLAGAGGLLLVARSGTLTPTSGLQPVLIAFVAVVIGGLGSLPGAVAGGFLLGGTTVALQVLLPEEIRPYRDAILYTLVIVILTFRPQGLLPSANERSRV
ncbi:branched-chain amino acid ABC transporter permease [Arthrobacter sp. MI7-26]|uniref:branched-chain amino acid ABC transporter permease n=1 Tax=Arthrobacter sp. MI7-26 TaxID=2993653 RepID=UPI002249092B|nr:branched-chain amino acid ABC transporter permease [Arthrobacter sp. MI7-26]MCX2750059.1 branched-chain amino acid ABC transporter permease [Arthrobacter sp. MI7-26]